MQKSLVDTIYVATVTRKKEFPPLVEEEEFKETGTPTTLLVSRHPGVTSSIPRVG
jgi:hypothetical protein